ncbi:MAG TPA: prepilin-type N-terminal cleavage/methylation domain-containing protein [Limnobacter sp.]|nr:prepilin-type N-terminal cleavage/methylation domain-containing protein [Limnobacter sp.]
MSPRSPRATGFTLLEVLIALGIVAVISVLSWRGLEEVLRSAKRVSDVDERMQTLQAVFGQLGRDLASLNLDGQAPGPETDLVQATGNGLLLQLTRRDTSEPAYREQVEWVWQGNALRRVARNTLNPNSPPSQSDPIPMAGLLLRTWREPGGWSSPIAIGNVQVPQATDLDLQGTALQPLLSQGTGPAPTPPGSGDNPPGNEPPTETAAPPANALVRAVEVTLTQPNGQSVTRLMLTGGIY